MNINNILPYRLSNNRIETNSPNPFMQSSKRPSDYLGTRSRYFSDDFSYGNYSTEKLLKDRNLIIDEKNVSAVNELLKNEVPATRENILRMVDIRGKIDSIVNDMSFEAAKELAGTNTFSGDIDKLSSAMKRISKALAQNSENSLGDEKKNVSEEDVDKAVKQVFGTEADKGKVTEQDRKIIKELMAEGIPVTLKNIQTVRNYSDSIQALGNLSGDSIAITIGTGGAATPQALENAETYAKAYAGQGSLTDEQIAGLEGDISRILGNYGIEPTKENIEAAKALIRNQVDVTEKNVKNYMEIRETVNELVKVYDTEAGAKLLKDNIRIETQEVTKLLDKIRAGKLAQQQRLTEAADLYDKLETTKLNASSVQSITNKDLKALEKEIVKLLGASGIEASQENIGAAKALIRSNMEVSRENIDKFIKLLRVFAEAENTGLVKTEASILQGSERVNTEQIKDVLQLLRNSGDAIQYLEGSSSKNYTQLTQLMSKIENIRSVNYTAVAFLMRNELPINIRNASIAFSMIKPGVTNYIDMKLDQQFDRAGASLVMPVNLTSGAASSTYSNNLQAKAYRADMQINISQEEFDGIAGALARNTLAVNRNNVLNAYEIQSSIYNVAEAAQEKDGGQAILNLLQKGISVEDYDIKELEALIKNKSIQPSAEEILQKTAQLKGVSDTTISLAIKYGVPMEIDKLSQLKLIMENRSSLGKELRGLEKLLGAENTPEVKALIPQIKAILPKASLKELKNGKDISDIYSEVLNKVKALEKETVSLSPTVRENLLQITGRIKENLDMHEYLNKGQTYLQLPVILNDRPTHLQVFVNDRHKGRKTLEEAENLDVVLNLETENFGLIDISMNIRDKSVGLGIKVDDIKQKRKLEAVLDKLSERIGKAGFNTRDITCEMRQEDKSTEEKDVKVKPQVASRASSNGRFEIRI